MKKILFFLAIILANSSFGQKPDTIIDGIKYSVLAKYSNGKVKDIGQHNFDCDAQIRKHGIFISYSPHFFMINTNVDVLHLLLFSYWIIKYGFIFFS